VDTPHLAITGAQPPLRPLRPPVLYRAPLPRAKLEAVVPDGQVTGMLQVDDRPVSVSGWRGTAGHNWGSEHADSWVWLHAADFGAAPALAEDDRAAVAYADPRGETRTVTHAALAGMELIMQRPGNRELTLSSSHAAYEYGARQPVPGIVPRSLAEG
jgi:hypothetical protein